MAARSLTVVPATLEHAAELAARMRKSDREEALASDGVEPLAAIVDSMKRSRAWAALYGSEVMAIWGVGEVEGSPRIGVVWAMTSTTVDRHPRAFWCECRRRLPELFGPYEILVNAIDARYEAALRWARRLGFTVGPARALGVQGQPFHPIYLHREDIACARSR